MSDLNEVIVTPDSAPTPPEDTITITRAQLNAQMAAARRSGLESNRSTTNTTVPQTPSPDSGHEALRLEVELLKSRQMFDRHTLGVVADTGVADQLFKLYQVDRPESPTEWVVKMAAMFGISKINSTPVQAPNFAPSDSTAKRFDPQSLSGIVDPGAITPEQRAQMTPSDTRALYERQAAMARGRSGAPPRPDPGRK